MKRIVNIIVVTALVAVAAIVGYLLFLHAYVFTPIVWTASNGGLELQYNVGKNQRTLIVKSCYLDGNEPKWVLSSPTSWWGEFRSRRAPKPETLMQNAGILVSLSSVEGLVSFYHYANAGLKEQIKAAVRELRNPDATNDLIVKQLITDGKYPWLTEVRDYQ